MQQRTSQAVGGAPGRRRGALPPRAGRAHAAGCCKLIPLALQLWSTIWTKHEFIGSRASPHRQPREPEGSGNCIAVSVCFNSKIKIQKFRPQIFD